MADVPALPASPPGWGDDSLSDYLRQASHNSYGSFVQPTTRPWYDKLLAVDQSFVKAIGLMNATPAQVGEPLMLVNANAAFRAASELALQARACEAYALMRSCLECALYAVHFHRKPELFEVWARRGEGERQRRAVRNAFRANHLLDGVTALNNAVGERAKHLYEFAIDMGAHPTRPGSSPAPHS
jgi:hypothetical protein